MKEYPQAGLVSGTKRGVYWVDSMGNIRVASYLV